jgi:hypothetical protein
MTRRRAPATPTLAAADLALAIFGPWHPEAHIDGEKVLWHSRCRTERLQQLWTQHAEAIRAAAGTRRLWIEERLWFAAECRRVGGLQ